MFAVLALALAVFARLLAKWVHAQAEICPEYYKQRITSGWRRCAKSACKAVCTIDIFKYYLCASTESAISEREREEEFRCRFSLPLSRSAFQIRQIWFSYSNFYIKPYTENTHLSQAMSQSLICAQWLKIGCWCCCSCCSLLLSKLRTPHDFCSLCAPALVSEWVYMRARARVCVYVIWRSHHLNTTKYYCVCT